MPPGVMVAMNASSEAKRPGFSPDNAVSGQQDKVSRPDVSARAEALPRLDARRLFAASREVIIEHEGADYRLRLTANGKLILTK